MVISNDTWINLGIGAVVGGLLVIGVYYLKQAFFTKKLAPAVEIQKELRKCSHSLKETNDVLIQLNAFFKDMEAKGM